MLTVGLTLASAVPAADEVSASQDLQRLRARIAELDQALNADKGRESGLQGEVQAAEQTLAQAAASVRASERSLAEQARRVDTARKDQAQAAQELERGRRDLAAALRAAYMAGSPGPLQLLFQQGDTSNLSRLDVDTAALGRAMGRRLDTVRQHIIQLAEADAALQREGAALDTQRVAAKAALAELRKAQEQRRGLLGELRQRNADRAAQLQQAKGEEQRLQKLIEGIRRALRDQPAGKFERGTAFSALRGRLPWPLRGELLARYGQPKAGGALHWSGWWIKAEDGSAVRAVADGRVAYVGRVQRYGLMVILDHPGEYLSLYGHLASSSVEAGESIAAGTALATAGSSGGHEASGLYFEIRKGTETVNPADWLAR